MQEVIVYDNRPTQELRPTSPPEEGPVSHRQADWTPLRIGLAAFFVTVIVGAYAGLFVLSAFIKPHAVSPGVTFTAPPAELSTSPTGDQGMVPAPATYAAPTTAQHTTPTRRSVPTPRPDPTRTKPRPTSSAVPAPSSMPTLSPPSTSALPSSPHT